MKRSSPPTFPRWLPMAVRQEAKKLWRSLPAEKDSAKSQEVLEQLISNPLMRRVWDELYRKRGKKGQFFNPACLTNASEAAAYREMARVLREKWSEANNQDAELLELEARWIELLPDQRSDSNWNEQDHAARLFFSRAYRAALDTEPQLAANARRVPDKLRGVAIHLRKLAADLKSIKIGVTEIYAEKLIEVAKDCESDATVTEPNTKLDPWLVTRRRGDTRRKTYVAKLFKVTDELFGKPLYSTIANVTNVVFSKSASNQNHVNTMTDKTVREILRGKARRIRPSFGPILRARLNENVSLSWRLRSLLSFVEPHADLL